MEGNKHHRLPIFLTVAVVVLASLSVATVASAEQDPIEDPVDTWVTTEPDAVTVEAETHSSSPGVSGTGTQAGGSAPRCYLRNYPTSEWDEDMSMEFFYYRMQKEPWKIICDGEWRGTVWLPIPEEGESTPGSAEPRDVAMRLRDRMPVPAVEVEINPLRGLVGAESWFWVDGYSGAPLTNSTDAFGELIEVEARVTRYELVVRRRYNHA